MRTYSDVTESANAQAALRASESRFRTMADAAPAFIWQSDAEGRVVWFNQAWLSLLGQTLEQAQAAPWEQRMHPDDYGAALAAFEHAVRHRQAFTFEFRVRRFNHLPDVVRQ